MPDNQLKKGMMLPQTLQDMIEQVIEAKTGDIIWPPATVEAVAGLQRYLQGRFGINLPASYRGLLGRTDGLEYNSYIIFGASSHYDPYLPGFQEFNDTLAECANSYIFFGETADEMFAMFEADRTWKAVDKASLSTLEEFPDFDTMLTHILHQALL